MHRSRVWGVLVCFIFDLEGLGTIVIFFSIFALGMKKFFVSNLIFLLGLNILIKSFWILGIDRSVQNALPSGEYGMYYALLNFTWLFNIFLDLGISNFNTRTIAQNPCVAKKYMSGIIPLKLLLSGLYAVVIGLVAWILGYNHSAFRLLMWLCLFQILSSIVVYLRSNISALLLFKTDSILSVLDKSLTIVFCSVLLWTPWARKWFSVETFVIVQVVSMFLTAIVALCICLKHNGKMRLKWNKKFMLAVLRYGFPFALLTLLMSFYNRLDSVMLERMLKDNGVASEIYASGFRLVDSVNMVAYLFSVLLLPLFAKLIKEKADVREIVRISFHILVLISFGFAIVSWFYADELMQLLYTKHISESAEVYRVLCFCFIPVSMTYIFGTLLTANGSLRKLNIVALSGVCINIVCDLLLIPFFKEIGSAYACLSAQIFTAVVQIIIALKIFKIKVSGVYCIRILGFVASLFAVAFLIHTLQWNWILRLGVSLMLFCVLSIVFKLFSIKDLLQLLEHKAKDKQTL